MARSSGPDDDWLCPSCGGSVDPTATACAHCGYQPGEAPPVPASELLPFPARVDGATPPSGSSGPPPRLPPTIGPPVFEPAPTRGVPIVAVALVVAVLVVIGGILALEARNQPAPNNSTAFVPTLPATSPTSTPVSPAPPGTTSPGTVPGTVPGTAPGALPGVPVPTLPPSPAPTTPAGWVDLDAPDGSWAVAFPTTPRPITGNVAPDGWRFTDVFTATSPASGATLRFAALDPTAEPTVEAFFASSATFLATLAQANVVGSGGAIVDGDVARRFVTTAAGTPTGAVEAWAVYGDTGAFLLISEAPTSSTARSAELDAMVRSLRTGP